MKKTEDADRVLAYRKTQALSNEALQCVSGGAAPAGLSYTSKGTLTSWNNWDVVGDVWF